MTAGISAAESRSEPLVAVICRAPMVYEAVAESLEGVAVVRRFDPRGDIADLLERLAPDAVVVDSDTEAAAAVPFARASRVPLVSVSLREPRIQAYVDGTWEERQGSAASPETVRNVVIAGIFGGRKR